MFQARYNISLDLGARLEISAGINAQLLPLVNQAVNAIAQATAANWKTEVMRAKLWSGEKDAYVKTIAYRMTGDFTAVVESDYKYVQDIETGRPPRDLKKMLDTSAKVRRTKDGTRFLIIPFRHNVKDMPDHVAKAAKKLTASSIVGQGQRRSGEIVSARVGMGMLPLGEKRQRQNPYLSNTGTREAQMGTKHQYSWGAKLAAGAMGPNAKGKTDRFAGMYRFNTSTKGAKRSSYLTFRVMSEKSNGWIIPAQPGQFLAKKVADEMRPLAEAAITEAIRRTMG
jgi:hypothetical protein